MACCPDAALDILIDVSNTVDESKLSKPDYYEYQILIAEALYKNDLIQTNDSAVFEAVRYYDSLAQIYPKNVEVILQKSRAHYYKAVGESEKDDIKNACSDYIIALRTIDEIKEKDRNYNIDYFNGLIYNRLASIYYYNDAFNLSISLDKMANECFVKSNSIHPIAYNYLCIAKMLSTMDLYDEEENYLNMADSLISNVLKIEDNQLKRKILMERALLASYRDNDNKKALELARQYMSKADGEEERILGHTQLGEIFYKDCQYDSALYYFEKDFSRNHYTMLHCGNRIIEICKIIGDNEKAAYYAPFIAEETNQEFELAPLKAELVAMYEQYEADKHKVEIRDLWLKIIMALTVGIIILVVVFFVVSKIRKRKHLNEIDIKDWYIDTLHGKIRKINAEHKTVKENLKSLENQSVILKDAKTREPVSFEEGMRKIKTDELCKKLFAITQLHIKTTVKYPELTLGNDERLYLMELFDKELNGALRSIIKEQRRLKKSDELLFCLYLLGLDNKHIAAVTGKSYHNVFVRSQKCLEILGGGENLQEAIIIAISKSDII
ncbi:MAG: hypothetical protein II817_00270 [Bacteroidales bacterium]|nr:hypothetical protein [Bacteroidales bacterium]